VAFNYEDVYFQQVAPSEIYAPAPAVLPSGSLYYNTESATLPATTGSIEAEVVEMQIPLAPTSTSSSYEETVPMAARSQDVEEVDRGVCCQPTATYASGNPDEIPIRTVAQQHMSVQMEPPVSPAPPSTKKWWLLGAAAAAAAITAGVIVSRRR
jgi:hypothetical protein